jgi:hypothetical protein
LGLKIIIFFIIFFGGLECVGHSFAYVAHFVFLRDVWIRTLIANLAAHLPNLATHFPDWILDPAWEKFKSEIRDKHCEHHISESLETIFWVKNT